MSVKHSNCLVCSSTKIEESFECADYFVSGEKFSVYTCSDCGFTFTQDIPDAKEIAPYYKSEEYISHSNTQKGLINKLYHGVREIMLNKKLRLIRSLTPGTTLLDVGCGIGYFPYFMKTKGFIACGMEVDSEARQFAADNYDLKVHEPAKLLATDEKEKYDVITLWHVMEHLHDPKSYLSWIQKALKQDGILLIALPNCDSYDARHFRKYWAAYDVPRHLWHFTPKTFKQYITQFGFELTGINRLPFDAYYNSLMSAKYRGDKVSLLSGFIIGFLSNLRSLFNPEQTSSVIYVLRKTK